MMIKNEYKRKEILEVGKVLLEYYLETLSPITYSDLCELVNFKVLPQRIGYYLGFISEICYDNNLPNITAIVVNKNTKICGDGFFNDYYPCPKNERQIIHENYLNKIRKCNAWPFLYWDFIRELDEVNNG